MGVVIRQSIFTSVFSYVGVVIGYVNLLWLFPLALDPDQIGLTKIIQDIAILIVPFAQIGLAQSFVKFFPVVSNIEEQQKAGKATGGFLLFMLFGVIISFILCLIIYFVFEDPILSLFKENSPLVLKYFNLILLLTFLLVVTGVLEAYCRSLLKIIIPNFIREVLIRVLTGGAVILYFYEIISFEYFLIGIVAIYFIALVTLLAYLYLIKALYFSFDWSFLKLTPFGEILKYGLFTVIGSSSTLIVLRVDGIMVTSMLGLASYGIYTIVFYIAAVIELPRRAITQIISPLIAKAFTSNNLDEIGNIYRKTSINQLLIGLLLFIGIISNLDNIFYFVPNREVFEVGKTVVLIIGLGKLIDMAAGANGEIIIMSKYYKYNILFIAFLAVFTIAGNYFLIPVFGIDGAAAASALAMVIFNFAKFAFIKYKFKANPFSLATLKAITLGLAIYFCVAQIPSFDNIYTDILVRSFIITSFFVVFVLWLRISEEATSIYYQFLDFLGIKSS